MRSVHTCLRRGVLAVLLLVAASAFASDSSPMPPGWDWLQPNLTPQQVATLLEPTAGPPVLVTKARGSMYETWFYDNGGCVVFVRGVLDYWTPPKNPKPDVVKRAP